MIFVAAEWVSFGGYELLSRFLPELFPDYNPIQHEVEYEALMLLLSAVAALIAVFATNYILGVFDNTRYEDTVSATDGLYRIFEELPSFIRRTVIGDLIASLVPQALFLLLASQTFPKQLSDFTDFYFAPHTALIGKFGALLSYFIIFAVAFFGRLISAPHALSRYRGLWMTSFVEG